MCTEFFVLDLASRYTQAKEFLISLQTNRVSRATFSATEDFLVPGLPVPTIKQLAKLVFKQTLK